MGNIANKKGVINQYQGPYEPNASINFNGATIRFGVQISIKDFMKNPNFNFTVNYPTNESKIIYIGRTMMYESDDFLPVSSISFGEDGAPPSFTLEYIVLKEG